MFKENEGSTSNDEIDCPLTSNRKTQYDEIEE